jgi:hypothetical protein
MPHSQMRPGAGLIYFCVPTDIGPKRGQAKSHFVMLAEGYDPILLTRIVG